MLPHTAIQCAQVLQLTGTSQVGHVSSHRDPMCTVEWGGVGCSGIDCGEVGWGGVEWGVVGLRWDDDVNLYVC